MQFTREPITDKLLEEVTPLLFEHWKEISHYPDIELNPAVTHYIRFEQLGILRLYTSRDEQTGELAGYNVFIVQHNPHYSQSLQAVQDILFLAPKYRKALWGYRFIKWCDGELRKEGVQVVYQHLKVKHNFGAMLERQGYELVDLIYAKRLDGEK